MSSTFVSSLQRGALGLLLLCGVAGCPAPTPPDSGQPDVVSSPDIQNLMLDAVATMDTLSPMDTVSLDTPSPGDVVTVPDSGLALVSVPNEDILAYCSFAISCGLTPFGTMTAADCVQRLQNFFALAGSAFDPRNTRISLETLRGSLACGATNSCANFQTCSTQNHDATYCGMHPGRSCDGNYLVDCTSGPAVAFNCALHGAGTSNMTCLEANGTADCVLPASPTCDPTASPERTRCDGNNVIHCAVVGQEQSWSCGAELPNGQCAADSSGRVGCVSFPTGCSGEPRCVGAQHQTCVNGVLLAIDCAATFGGSCVASTSTPCQSTATACNAGSPGSCEGTTMRTCLNGEVRDFDCATHGFTGCTVDTHGAHCTP